MARGGLNGSRQSEVEMSDRTEKLFVSSIVDFENVARWPHLAAFFFTDCTGEFRLVWTRVSRSPACIIIKMAKHVGCFWFRDAIL